MDHLLFGCPAGLELNQSLVYRLGSAKAQGGISVLQIPANCFPHDKIVGTEVKIVFVFFSVFVKCFPFVMVLYSLGNRRASVIPDRHETRALGDEMTMDVFEEPEGLRGKSVLLAREEV